MAKPSPNAVLRQRIELAPGLIVMQVIPENWQYPDFDAGQFAVLGLPGKAPRVALSEAEEKPIADDKWIRRAYSIASSSRDGQCLEFFITMVRSGALTPRLFQLELGDKLFLGPKPAGVFLLDQAPADKHVVLISTGTGLAPYISMLRSQLEFDPNRSIAVVHGARHSWDLGYAAELQMLQLVCPNFKYLPVISRPQNEFTPWGGRVGYVQDVWKSGAIEQAWGLAPSPENTHVFLCGNPGMIEGMLETLDGGGYVEQTKTTPGQIHVEKYW
jgi:ferredoxin/flavodoxin---NADP+ reductase